MTRRGMPRQSAVAVLALGLLTAPLAAQDAGRDTIRAGRFDFGKMWTFEYAPGEYFSTTYGFSADSAWFDRARMAALRVPGCSASFVSPHGLLATNHHCVRGRVAALSREGENLLDDGFRARDLADERPIPGYYADQLLATLDVSDEVLAAVDAAPPGAREAARTRVLDQIEARLRARYADVGAQLYVQIIALYNGGRYSAYVFRRFTDIRLVAAAELQLGFFGGDPDNFTYPRHALDFAILRVYDPDGTPFETPHWFRWGSDGIEEGDAVFLIGNPGPTNRLSTMAQLEYQRDVEAPVYVAHQRSRLDAMQAFYASDRAAGDAIDVRNRMFSLSNRLKAQTGRLDGLRTPEILARKADAERQLREAIAAEPALTRRYGGLLDSIARLQATKRALGPMYGAAFRITDTAATSGFEARLLLVGTKPAGGIARDSVRGSKPPALERALLAERLADFRRYLGADHPIVRALGGAPPEDAAAELLASSILSDSAELDDALRRGTLPPTDPGIVLARRFGTAYEEYRLRSAVVDTMEVALAGELGRARFAIYGTAVAPDASSSPRITDGRVLPYEYNGTRAPVYTTFYGMYGLYYSHAGDPEWALPDRWKTPPVGLPLATPLNFISTADSYGGNSGSPAFTKDLALVGLNFDRNIEGMPRAFIYLAEQGRNIMVDVRAIEAALDHVYDLDRIVAEVRTGRLFATERDADAAAGRGR